MRTLTSLLICLPLVLAGCSNAHGAGYYDGGGGGGGGGLTNSPLSYTAVGTASGGAATTIQLAPPGSIADGDLCVYVVVTRNGTVSSPPEGGGWTLDYSADTESTEWLYVYSKVSTGTEPATWDVTGTASTQLAAYACFRGFSGDATAQRYIGKIDTFVGPAIPTEQGDLVLTVYSGHFDGADLELTLNGDLGDSVAEELDVNSASDQCAYILAQTPGVESMPSVPYVVTPTTLTEGFAQAVTIAYAP